MSGHVFCRAQRLLPVRALPLFALLGLCAACDSVDPAPVPLEGAWRESSPRTLARGNVYVGSGTACYRGGCVPVIYQPDEAASDYRLSLNGDAGGGPYRLERTSTYFLHAGDAEPLVVRRDTVEGRYSVSGDTLRFDGGQTNHPYLFTVDSDSLFVRLPPPEGPVGEIPNECHPWGIGPLGFAKCSAAFERVGP